MMKEFLSLDIDGVELIRSLGRLEELRQNAYPIEREDFGRPLSPNKLRAVWNKSSGSVTGLPSFLIGEDSALSNFLPRVLAFPGGLSPISSTMKIWSIEDLRHIIFSNQYALRGDVALGFVGLIVGELISTAGADVDLRLVGTDGIRRTLSFVCAQAVMKGWRDERLAKVVERWLEASSLTGNDVNVAEAVQIANMSAFLCALSDKNVLDYSVSQDLAYRIQYWTDAQKGSSQHGLLRSQLLQIADALIGVKSREKRFDIVTQALEKHYAGSGSSLEQGFLISLIEPGSFEFLELAKRLDRKTGAVMTAYCAFTVIMGKTSALRQFNGFGLAVLTNDLQIDVEGRCDISIAELRILNNSRRAAPILFRTRSPWLIDVELAPMLIGSFGNLAKRRASSHKMEEKTESFERDDLLRQTIEGALMSLENAYGLLNKPKSTQDGKPSAQRRNRKPS
jgi:hypothetical protein